MIVVDEIKTFLYQSHKIVLWNFKKNLTYMTENEAIFKQV